MCRGACGRPFGLHYPNTSRNRSSSTTPGVPSSAETISVAVFILTVNPSTGASTRSKPRALTPAAAAVHHCHSATPALCQQLSCCALRSACGVQCPTCALRSTCRVPCPARAPRCARGIIAFLAREARCCALFRLNSDSGTATPAARRYALPAALRPLRG